MSENKLVIFISGGSGIGKTTLCDSVSRHFCSVAGVTKISQDGFYFELNSSIDLESYNFDHPSAIDWVYFRKKLVDLTKGRSVVVPKYSFIHHNYVTHEILESKNLILVEGTLVNYFEYFRDLANVKIHLTCSLKKQKQQKIKRDIEERGRSLRDAEIHWERQVYPTELEFCHMQSKFVDHCICANDFDYAFNSIVDIINYKK